MIKGWKLEKSKGEMFVECNKYNLSNQQVENVNVTGGNLNQQVEINNATSGRL